MTDQDLINDVKNARQIFLEVIAGLSTDKMLQPGAVGFWSVKDVLAHITAWESELITALVRVEQGKKGVPNIVKIDEIDEWNAEQYHASVRRDLNIIMDDFHGVHKHLIEAINALDHKILNDNRKFDWMEGEALSYLVYENAVWHEEEHAEDIAQWKGNLTE